MLKNNQKNIVYILTNEAMPGYIKIGEEVYFSRDENIKAKVLQGNKIELNGKERGLSKSAQELLNYKKQPAGTLFWKYDEETLDERRRRMDEESLNNNLQ